MVIISVNKKNGCKAVQKGCFKMKDSMKKVVILDNLSSPYVHQAIIVMRDYNPKLESHAVIEAERIVNAYLDNMKLNIGSSRKHKSRKNIKKYIFFSACALAVILSAVAFIYR